MQDSTQTYIILRQYINSSLYAVRTPTSCSTTTTTKTQLDQEQDLKIRSLKEQSSSTLLTNDLRHPKENRLFKGPKSSPSHPSEKESSIKMIMQYRRHNYDRRKPRCSNRDLSEGSSVHHKSHTEGLDWTGAVAVTDRQPACLPELWQGLEDWNSPTLYIKYNFLPQKGKVPSQPESTVS